MHGQAPNGGLRSVLGVRGDRGVMKRGSQRSMCAKHQTRPNVRFQVKVVVTP